jgi:hypothetical protein
MSVILIVILVDIAGIIHFCSQTDHFFSAKDFAAVPSSYRRAPSCRRTGECDRTRGRTTLNAATCTLNATSTFTAIRIIILILRWVLRARFFAACFLLTFIFDYTPDISDFGDNLRNYRICVGAGAAGLGSVLSICFKYITMRRRSRHSVNQ